MTFYIMTALAKQRRLPCQESVMVASMDLMTVQAVFRHGRMFKSKRTSHLGMALITEVVDRIGLDHPLGIGRAHRIMAA